MTNLIGMLNELLKLISRANLRYKLMYKFGNKTISRIISE